MNTSSNKIVELNSFHFVFQLSKKIVFEVNYYRLGNNKNRRFCTSAAMFNQPKTDYNECGQAQDSLLSGKAKIFYNKWDFLHIQDLTQDQYSEIIKDIEILKLVYNFIENEINGFGFLDIKALSKNNPKK